MYNEIWTYEMEEEAYALYCLGVEASECGDSKKAREFLLASLELSPHFKTLTRLATLCLENGDELGGLGYLRSAHAANPRSDRTAVDLAEALLNSEHHEEAARIVENVLQRNSTYGPAKRVLERLSENKTTKEI